MKNNSDFCPQTGIFSTRKKILGFTLIELMVSITVMVIVSSVIWAGKHKEEDKMGLRLAAFLFGQSLREYQEKALSGENIACPNPSFNVCGFGVRLHEGDDFFTPFIDCSSDCGTSNHSLTGNDLVLSGVKFGQKTKICSMSSNTLYVVFTPPDPTVFLNNVKWGAGETNINLCLKDDISQTRTVKVNYAGKIEIQ